MKLKVVGVGDLCDRPGVMIGLGGIDNLGSELHLLFLSTAIDYSYSFTLE